MSTAPPAQDDHVTPELPEVVVGEWEETLRELVSVLFQNHEALTDYG
jgi:hypothetical protein